MTKIEKENLKKECDAGMHALPYDTLVKDAEKKERRKVKNTEKRIKRIIQKTLIEETAKIAKLQTENAELKHQLEDLKGCDIQNIELTKQNKILSERLRKLTDKYPQTNIASENHEAKQTIEYQPNTQLQHIDYDIPETFDGRRDEIANFIVENVKYGNVGKCEAIRLLNMIGCNDYVIIAAMITD